MARFTGLFSVSMALLLMSLPILADDWVLLSNNIQPVEKSALVTALTAQDFDAPLSFTATLRMRNFSEFQERLARGEKIDAKERAERYEPSAADYQAVVDWLKACGFTITRRDSHRLSIFARGKVGQIATAFRVRFARVNVDGTTYFGAITPPSVPAKIASQLLGINGLQPWMGRH